ncbi:MAG: iron uptake transporter permease EfeU [Rhodoglobus sp.]|uniref:iron uptake transporter permease EfeU n=1 Tax=Salinibacterium sp. G-O1 TaxID=3046208 RepID=UPI0024BAE6F3|nr:iron uptake transporter permease EfeU [Salinibacterium sp. G-O1]MDJ0334486.1 FTR1 family protein [Salinibacterium sp. G-O1]
MLSNFLIGLREGLEAGLIVGILVAYLIKISRRDVLPRLWMGIGAAIAISLATGAILTWGPYGLSFQGQEILGGALSILAVILVTWMIFWMGSHARSLKGELQSKLDAAVAGAGLGIVVVGFVSVGREGVETALFIWASVNSGANAVVGTVSAIVGILVSVVIAYLIYRGLVRINLSKFFTWTGLFLILVAAGVLSYGIGDLQEAGVVAGHSQIAFSLATAIPPSSWYGTILSGLFNFTPEPTWLQFIAWLAYLIVITTLFLRRVGGGRAAIATDAPVANTATTPIVASNPI